MENNTQLATVGQQAVEVAPARPDMFQAVMAAATNPALDPDRIKAFLEMAREMDQEQKRQEFNQAFAAAHAEISAGRITKRGEIVYPGKNGGQASVIKFLTHDDISRLIKPILHAHGLTATYSSETLTNPPKAVTVMTIIHRNGHSREWRSIPMPLVDSGGGKNDVQGAGSISTYGRRYVTVTAFDIVAEGADDDGNKGLLQQYITQEQADNIDTILDELEGRAKGNRAAFLNWASKQFSISKPDELLSDNLPEVMTALKKKLAAKG